MRPFFRRVLGTRGRRAGLQGLWVGAALLAGCGSPAESARVQPRTARIAVAANFQDAARQLGSAFESAGPHAVAFSFGSTGQLYAQIAQSAPFDAFLAADRGRPARAVSEGWAVPGSQFTYARGRIALFSRDPALVTGPDTLSSARIERLAIAEPGLAPYGAAAVETLRELGAYDALEGSLVRGLNVAQAYQFVHTGHAALGFVALAQIAGHGQGSRWLVPDGMHAPIAQDAVLLKRGAANVAAVAFLEFLKTEAAGAVLRKYGYGSQE